MYTCFILVPHILYKVQECTDISSAMKPMQTQTQKQTSPRTERRALVQTHTQPGSSSSSASIVRFQRGTILVFTHHQQLHHSNCKIHRRSMVGLNPSRPFVLHASCSPAQASQKSLMTRPRTGDSLVRRVIPCELIATNQRQAGG